MSKEKKKEGASKPRNVVTISLNKEMREQLEEELREPHNQNANVKLAQVARAKLARQLAEERKRK